MTVTATGSIDACYRYRFDRSATTQILVLGAPEELTRLVADRIGKFEGTRQPTHFAQSVGEIPFCFRPPATAGLLTAHPRESPSLLPRDLVPLRVGAATNLCRQAAIVAGGCEWGARLFALLVVVRPPLRPVIDTLFVDDQDTVLADRFDRVRGDPAVALGTLVCASIESRLLTINFEVLSFQPQVGIWPIMTIGASQIPLPLSRVLRSQQMEELVCL